ncbi:hypothetical protein PR202_ga28720 [Eleusine coracana subsp. coracana]|uniref:non-specific serine/threonine protein kinase n=1 Tax=Eleusine coracana subsp. coracana TaxID=191504 RepID=A0AAV5DJX6_ELECO|nr:hypothetical protein PR202_ga28720 [Eleusine coracana subsp. coracana]
MHCDNGRLVRKSSSTSSKHDGLSAWLWNVRGTSNVTFGFGWDPCRLSVFHSMRATHCIFQRPWLLVLNLWQRKRPAAVSDPQLLQLGQRPGRRLQLGFCEAGEVMAIEDYHVIELVGEGSFGKVYKGRRKYTRQTVAMKFILKHGKTDKDIHNLRQEIEILRKLKHENIIEMIDAFETPQEFCVVTEFAQGELFEVLEDDKCLPEDQVQAIAKQLVKALYYLHSNRIIHRDMKPQNILIGKGSVVKVCSVHARMYELFVGQPPFYTNSVYALIRHIVKDPVKYPDKYEFKLQEFLEGFTKQGRNTATYRENASDNIRGNNKVDDPVQPTKDHQASYCTPLDKLEKTSQTVKGANSIVEDTEALSTVLSPIKVWLSNKSPSSPRELNIDGANQALRIVKNLIDAGSCQPSTATDSIICIFLDFTSLIIRTKLSDAYGLAVKCLAIARKLLDTSDTVILSSYERHWLTLYELYSQILVSTIDPSGRISRESTACLAQMLSRVISGLKASMASEGPKPAEENLLKIIDHAQSSQLLELLCQCLITSGSDIISGSTNMCTPIFISTRKLMATSALKAGWQTRRDRFNGRYNAGLLNLFGLRDGSIGLLETRLKWGGPLAIEQACSAGIPQLLVRLLTDGFSKGSSDGKDGSTNRSGLSPLGVVWTLSALSQCLNGGFFREILYKRNQLKLLTDLLSDVHLKALAAWTGLGGGKRGVQELLNSVVDILAFPFVAVQSSPNMPSASASINSGFLLNVASPGGRIGSENKEMLKTIEHSMPQYIQVLLELLKEGLLNPSRVASLFEGPIAKETLLDFLMIVSDLARMSKDFYEPIDKAGLVGFLKNFLSSEDPDIRAKACSAIGNMCRHSSYFYGSLSANKVIQLVVERCSDPDKRTRKFACFAVGNAAYHNGMLYEELRRSIPQLTNLLLGPEEDKTKGNAAGALSNLVRNSDILCEDIVSQGAIQALLKMVSSFSTVALSPSRRDALTESPLRIVLFALRKMCDHVICRNFLRSSELLPVIVHLRQSPDPTISEYASAIASRAYQA